MVDIILRPSDHLQIPENNFHHKSNQMYPMYLPENTWNYFEDGDVLDKNSKIISTIWLKLFYPLLR